MSNLTPHISFFDPSFSESKTAHYHVYLQLSVSSLTYTIFNPVTSTFIGLEKYLLNDIYNDYSMVSPLKDILAANQLLQKTFKLFHVAYVNERATLIPSAIFNKNELAQYHRFNYSAREEDVFLADRLLNLDGYNVYSVPDFIKGVFQEQKNIRFHHFSSALIEASISEAKKHQLDLLVHVHILPSSFQIMVVKNQLLEIYNSFSYQTSEDFIYYLLFVFNQLAINTSEISVCLTGEVDKNSAIYDMMQNYIKTITFGKRPVNLKYSYLFEDVPPHYYYSLFNQYLCE